MNLTESCQCGAQFTGEETKMVSDLIAQAREFRAAHTACLGRGERQAIALEKIRLEYMEGRQFGGANIEVRPEEK